MSYIADTSAILTEELTKFDGVPGNKIFHAILRTKCRMTTPEINAIAIGKPNCNGHMLDGSTTIGPKTYHWRLYSREGFLTVHLMDLKTDELTLVDIFVKFFETKIGRGPMFYSVQLNAWISNLLHAHVHKHMFALLKTRIETSPIFQGIRVTMGRRDMLTVRWHDITVQLYPDRFRGNVSSTEEQPSRFVQLINALTAMCRNISDGQPAPDFSPPKRAGSMVPCSDDFGIVPSPKRACLSPSTNGFDVVPSSPRTINTPRAADVLILLSMAFPA